MPLAPCWAVGRVTTIDIYILGYRTGRQVERTLMIAAADDLAASQPLPRGDHEGRVAERVALFEACAAELAQRMGRPPGYRYDGGPVEWETGQPARIGVAA